MPSSQADTATGGVQKALNQAEGLAEDIQDDLLASNWAAATSKVASLRTLEQPLAGAAPGASASQYTAYLDSLDTAVKQKNRFRALETANRVSHVINAMMANYPTKVPIEVADMDVAARDAQYAADQGSWAAAAAASAEIRRTYSAVQAHVKGRDPALDARVTGEMAKLDAAIAARSKSTVDSLAKAILDDVDKVEATY
jgi:hypothetical protein